METYAAALQYLRYGWSTIPIWPPGEGQDGKRPAVPSWTAYTRRHPTGDELAAWYATEERNIAVICGTISDGLVVIDCDDAQTYNAMLYLYPQLRHSLTATTGKGFHIYTVAPEPVRTATFNAFGHRHHIKGEGSYVIAPPSRHQSGRQYEFVEDVPPVRLDLPRLYAAVAALDPASAVAPQGRRRGHDPAQQAGADNHWVERAFREGAAHGERDDLTFRLACYLLRHLPKDVTQAILELWAEYRCEQRPDRWGPDDIAAKIRSASNYFIE